MCTTATDGRCEFLGKLELICRSNAIPPGSEEQAFVGLGEASISVFPGRVVRVWAIRAHDVGGGAKTTRSHVRAMTAHARSTPIEFA
jgi:hypothetical protein